MNDEQMFGGGEDNKVETDKTDNIAIIIPVKEESKRLPGKWKLELPNQNHLLDEAITKALAVTGTGNVYITTSSKDIIDYLRDTCPMVEVINRPEELDGEIPLEVVIQHAIAYLPAEIERVILMQITNPFTTPADLKQATKSNCMGVTHNGSFYSQTKKDWLESGLRNKQGRMGYIFMEKSVDIDTPDDYNKAVNLLNNEK